MTPTDHALVAVLPVVAVGLLRSRRLPAGGVVLVTLFASLLPDLVDKPLAWTLGVVPSGRMVLHSAVFAVPIVVAVLVVSYRLDRLTHGVAFGWGYLSHLVGDFHPALTQGSDYYFYPNLFWPLMEANPDRNPGFGNHALVLDPVVVGKLALLALLFGYVAFDLWKRETERRRP